MLNFLKALVSTVFIGIASVSVAQAEQVRVGVAAEPFPPFYSPDSSGNWSGWEIDFIHAICVREKLDCVITPVAWDGIIPALLSKKIDLIVSSMSITDERKKIIDFSDKYYDSPIGLIGPKTEKFGVSPADMKGKIVGVPTATTHANFAKKHFTDAAEIKEYQTVDESLQDLAAGRIDAVLSDKFNLDDFLKTPQGSCCDMKGNVTPDVSIYGPGVGAATRKEDASLKAKVNDGIKAIRADGTYDKITKKYFAFSIYQE